MVEFWYDLPPVLRAVMGSVLLGIAVLMFLAGIRNRLTIIVGAVGLVCVLFAKAGHDDGGYNF
jgi:hypothetical protein